MAGAIVSATVLQVGVIAAVQLLDFSAVTGGRAADAGGRDGFIRVHRRAGREQPDQHGCARPVAGGAGEMAGRAGPRASTSH